MTVRAAKTWPPNANHLSLSSHGYGIFTVTDLAPDTVALALCAKLIVPGAVGNGNGK
jgi:hypothetical protein